MRMISCVCLVALVTTCTPGAEPEATDLPGPSAPVPTPSALDAPSVAPDPRFSIDRVMSDVRALTAMGPREATSSAFREAGRFVVRRLQTLGYDVRRERFRVPAGRSWGVPVPEGSTFNVVAEASGFEKSRPYVIVGAHLDTVPQAPGANDNASGVAIVLELARLARIQPPRVPTVFIAFGAEEPRAPGDDGHHYGSNHHARRVRSSSSLLGALSIDRVGYGRELLICTGGRSPRTLQRALVRSARRLELPANRCINRTSDHWPFERRGFVGARLDGGRFPGYHSERDIVTRVQPAQIDRAGRTAWHMLRTVRARDL